MILLDTDRVNVERSDRCEGEPIVVKIYAHRGASAELPENTIPAFERALQLGVFGIELDVHLSRDGVAVVMHDETLDRTTNGTGAIADLDLAQLKALDAGAGATIPTLAEVLDVVGGELHVDIEVKAAAAADAVIGETSKRPELRFAISSFDHHVLRHVRSRESGIELWPLTIGARDATLETAVELAATNVAIHEAFVNQDIVDYLRGKGLGCWVWTINDPARAAEIAAFGVVGICTDDPAAMTYLASA